MNTYFHFLMINLTFFKDRRDLCDWVDRSKDKRASMSKYSWSISTPLEWNFCTDRTFENGIGNSMTNSFSFNMYMYVILWEDTPVLSSYHESMLIMDVSKE